MPHRKEVKIMKKILFAGIALSTVLSITACGKDDSTSKGNVTKPSENTTVVSETTTSATKATTIAQDITTTAAVEAGNADVTAIVRKWDYQKRDQNNMDTWDPIAIGTITVNADGTYSYESNEGYRQTGNITLQHEEYSNGDKTPYFSFKDDSGEFFIGVYCNQNEQDIYYIGNGGMERLVREGSNTPVSTAEETPNEWGFITVKDLPANGLSAGILEGTWQNTQDDSETITFYGCDRYSGSYTLQNHADYNQGQVLLEYNYAADNTVVYWFNLYRNAGGAPISLAVPQNIPADTLYPLDQNHGYYTRVN